MVAEKTIDEIKNNNNTGVEYEIALFRCLLKSKAELQDVDAAILSRCDAQNINLIIRRTSIDSIINELQSRSLTLIDVSFETQNDDIGPADIVMLVRTQGGLLERIGISVKHANACTLNVTGRKFLTESQIQSLMQKLPRFTEEYVNEMMNTYGHVGNWFRKRKPSKTTDRYIDLIREEVIAAWSQKSDSEKHDILMEAYQETSPIQYWVYTYLASSLVLDTDPYKIAPTDIPLVVLKKYQTSYVGFYLRNQLIGKMQVKFNNGFVERCKKSVPDKIVEGVQMSFGQPFSSWNFSLVNSIERKRNS